ncbi:MAG: hypothetical protein M0P12_03250 [Paludibacteraceae bacterium]|nr:hypothetical protein [Paludibacteraceae bacterium]
MKDEETKQIEAWFRVQKKKLIKGELLPYQKRKLLEVMPELAFFCQENLVASVVPFSLEKQELMRLAILGKKKPSSSPRLSDYLEKGNELFDAEFRQRILNLNPLWIIGEGACLEEIKYELTKSARNGEQRPDARHELYGMIFNILVNNTSEYFDSFFKRKILALNPSWFEEKLPPNEKEELLSFAKEGYKPNHNTKNYRVLYYLTNKEDHRYDQDFDLKIRRLAPHWFP